MTQINQSRIDALLRHIRRAQAELDELEANPEYDDNGYQTEAYLMEYDLAIATYAGLRERIGDLYVAQHEG